ncbi:MAG: hypothetical protein JXR84_21380 [Anaerolineae bacterium]|nr:hypothetical protein [Anaerolineae bacterium]
MPQIYDESGLYALEGDDEYVFGDIENAELEALAEAVIELLKHELRLENERQGMLLR